MEKSNRTAIIALAISAISVTLSMGSLLVSKWSFDLNAAKDIREQQASSPLFDMSIKQVPTPFHMEVRLSITNRAAVSISPRDISVTEPTDVSFMTPIYGQEDAKGPVGDLLPMGTITPGKAATIYLTIVNPTRIMWVGNPVRFDITIRFSDDDNTTKTFSVMRAVDFK